LSEADQEVLTVSAWYDLTALQAARVLGCSPGAYAVRLHRARHRLRRLIGDDPAGAARPPSTQEFSDEEARHQRGRS
jgi:RNA polymerase sigma-70 factor, ECF subfamily